MADGNNDNFTTFNVEDILEPYILRRHELSRGHTQNVAIFLELDDGKITGAPSTEEFCVVGNKYGKGSLVEKVYQA